MKILMIPKEFCISIRIVDQYPTADKKHLQIGKVFENWFIKIYLWYRRRYQDEYDVGAGEAAKTNDDDKILHDLGKVIRESKDVLDGLMAF